MDLGGFPRRIALHTTLLTAGVAQPLLQLYGNNAAVFTSARMSGPDVVVFGVFVVLAPVAVIAILDMLAGFLGGTLRTAARNGLVSLSALPLGMLVVRGVPGPWPAGLVLAIAVAFAVTAALARFRGVRSWVSWMAPLAPAVLALFVLSSQAVIWEADASVVDVNKAARTTVPGAPVTARTDPTDVSVLWIQLDEAPLWPLLRSDGNVNTERFPGFAALAENSTWYRNALGVSQTTVDAVPAALTGRKPVTGRAPTYWNYRNNLFSLAYGHRAMDVHEIATALCPKEACASVSVSGSDAIANGGGSGSADSTATSAVTSVVGELTTEPGPDRAQFLKDMTVVLGHKLLPRGLRDRLPRIDEGWGGFGTNTAAVDDEPSDPAGSTDTLPGATSSTTAPVTSSTGSTVERSAQVKRNTVKGWERDGARSQVPVLRDMVFRAAQSGLPTVHFAHVLLPHRPWQLTPDMRTTRFVQTDKRDASVEDRVRDEYQAFLAQYAATDSVISEMVAEMKRSANWDRTMIIVTADHGIAFEPGESKRKDINPRRTDTLEEIYRVPLFVKWPDQTTPSTSDCGVQAFDLLPMVVAATGLDAGWTFDGVDVRTKCPQRDTRTIWWDKGSTTLTSDFAAARTTATRFSNWVDQDGDVDGIARTAGFEKWFDITMPSGAPKDSAIRDWTLRDAEMFTGIKGADFSAVPMQVDGTVRTSAALGDGTTGLVVMDGRVVAVIPELAGMRAGRNGWRSILLPSSLATGAHAPLLYVARGGPGSPVITLVGPPR